MAEISVTFVGSGDAFGSGGRFQTCIYVDIGASRFLLDCGASSLIAMKRQGLKPSLVDAILLTHLHGDHFGGLPFFILDAQLISRRINPITVAGPPSLESRILDSMEIFFPGSSRMKLRFPLQFLELKEKEPSTIGPSRVTPFRVIHESGAPSYALRIECEGKVITYSGDTEWTDELLPAAQGADLFICESYFFDKKVKYHLDYETLTAHRKALGCRRLILTHMSEELLSRVQALDVECAQDGTHIVLK